MKTLHLPTIFRLVVAASFVGEFSQAHDSNGSSKSANSTASGTSPTSDPSRLTLHQIENATLRVPPMMGDEPDELIKLINGTYKRDDYVVNIEKEAFGDLNGDGKGDAAVVYWENSGGTGYFKSLTAFVNKGGKPVTVEPKVVGDRVEIKDLQIKSGVIILKVLSHGPGEGACCPTVKRTATYRLVKGQLVGPDSLYD